MALQVAPNGTGREQETGEARPMTADKAPDQSKKQQGQHGIAQSEVPVHPVATDVAGDQQACNAERQCPMKDAGWKIPDADGVHIGRQCGEMPTQVNGIRVLKIQNSSNVTLTKVLHSGRRSTRVVLSLSNQAQEIL